MYREHGATGRRRGEQDLEIGAPAEVHAALGRITRDTLDLKKKNNNNYLTVLSSWSEIVVALKRCAGSSRLIAGQVIVQTGCFTRSVHLNAFSDQAKLFLRYLQLPGRMLIFW